MSIENCPKFLGCNAPLCPLDLKLSKCVHLRGEGICFYVREIVKDQPARSEIELKIYQAIDRNWETLMERGGSSFRQAIKKAAQTPSKSAAKTCLGVHHGESNDLPGVDLRF